jgi:predicted DNA-binding transcriptional regulator AlpA
MRVLRPTELYNHIMKDKKKPEHKGELKQGRLGVARTKFYKDYVAHEGDEQFVPATNVPRLRPIPLGERAVGFPEHEVDAFVDALCAFRDAQLAAAAEVTRSGEKPTQKQQERRPRGRPHKHAGGTTSMTEATS